jgi:hypothetical protein
VLPQIGASNQRVRWIDTGSEMPGFDNHVYVCDVAVLEMARLLGLPERSEYRQAVTDRDRLAAELERTVAERDDLQARFEAIDILASKGFVERKKTGRPKTKQEVGAV